MVERTGESGTTKDAGPLLLLAGLVGSLVTVGWIGVNLLSWTSLLLPIFAGLPWLGIGLVVTSSGKDAARFAWWAIVIHVVWAVAAVVWLFVGFSSLGAAIGHSRKSGVEESALLGALVVAPAIAFVASILVAKSRMRPLMQHQPPACPQCGQAVASRSQLLHIGGERMCADCATGAAVGRPDPRPDRRESPPPI